MAKGEISWRRRNEDGLRVQIYARHLGKQWLFYIRERRFEPWESLVNPPLADWLALLDAVRRRIARRLLRPEEADSLKQRIRQHYPEADLP